MAESQGTASGAEQKKKCSSEMGDIISEASYKYRTQDCVFNNQEALSEVQFDGSKASLEAALGNCTTTDKVREYGMQRTISFIVNAIPDLYDCENLAKIEQILIINNNNLLIRIVNKTADTDKNVLQVEIRNVLQLIEKEDSKVHAKLVTEKVKAEFFDWVSARLVVVREQVRKPYVVLAVLGGAVAAVSYFTFK